MNDSYFKICYVRLFEALTTFSSALTSQTPNLPLYRNCANHLTGFYMMASLTFNRLRLLSVNYCSKALHLRCFLGVPVRGLRRSLGVK